MNSEQGAAGGFLVIAYIVYPLSSYINLHYIVNVRRVNIAEE